MWVGVLYYVVREYKWYFLYSEMRISVCIYEFVLGEVRGDKEYLMKGRFVYEVF